jgi:hypothetical protein
MLVLGGGTVYGVVVVVAEVARAECEGDVGAVATYSDPDGIGVAATIGGSLLG